MTLHWSKHVLAVFGLLGLLGLLGWSLQSQPERAEAPVPQSLAAEPEEGETFVEFEGPIDGAQEGNDSPVIGEAELGLDTLTNTFDLALELEGVLPEEIRDIRLRRGAAGETGPVVLVFNLAKAEGEEEEGLKFTFLSCAMEPFPTEEIENLCNGNLYVQVRIPGQDNVRGQLLPEVDIPGEFDLEGIPLPLSEEPEVEAPLDEFVKDDLAFIQLGKILFWEMQAGSDGRTACATCHFHAGADPRDKNQIGLSPTPPDDVNPRLNLKTRENWFPFHKLEDPTDRDSVISDTAEVHGSQGVTARDFIAIRLRSRVDVGRPTPDKNVFGSLRQVEPRNTPTVINAIFKDRVFHDGRANRFFNGVNPFGADDPDARVWRHIKSLNQLEQVQICTDNSALASQAVGPPLSDFEMSWLNRRFPEIGRKLLYLKPLAIQIVDPNDSLIGDLANPNGRGLKPGITYKNLIQKAFHNRYWNYIGLVDGEFTQMEANFAMFWGMAIYEYESDLVSGETRFDDFAADWHGDLTTLDDDGIIDDPSNDLTDQEKEGLELFLKQGRCIECHSGSLFTSATVAQARPFPIEDMAMEHIDETASYDDGFYNIGVRPAAEDIGVGGSSPFGPLSITRRQKEGFPVKRGPDDPPLQEIPADRHVADRGAFQVPTLRNVELTGPYMHNGGMSTLEQVIEFYARGVDFFDEEFNPDLDPDVGGIGKVRGDQERIDAMVAFMKTLTDERVRYRKAPFDHPQITVPNGHQSSGADRLVRIPEVGADGGAPIKSFIEILQSGGFRAP